MIAHLARAGEMGAAGALRVAAYSAQGLLAASPAYAATLRALGTDGHAIAPGCRSRTGRRCPG